jgi:D-tyrosyl-tRNA(Tyr) deacylase
MKALVQRMSEAGVAVGCRAVAQIGRGLLVLLCVEKGDGPDEARRLARKIARLRIFDDETGKMNRTVVETAGRALVVSQFTLAADLRRGHRPGFAGAAPPAAAKALYERLAALLAEEGVPVETGEFAACAWRFVW